MGISPYSMNQDIKLEKVATSKVVKKKKRATKIGFARDEEDAELETEGPARMAVALETSIPAPPSYIAEDPVVAAAPATAVQTSLAAAGAAVTSPPLPPATPPPPLPALSETLPDEAHRDKAACAVATVASMEEEQPRTITSSSSGVKAPITTAAGDDKTSLYHRLDSLTSDLSKAFKAATEASCVEYQQLLSQLKELRAGVESEERRIGESRERLCKLEAEQHVLAEKEEFDQAEALNVLTEGVRSEILSSSASLDKLKGSISASEKELRDCENSQLASLEDVMSRLLLSKDKQQKDLSSTVRESTQQLQIEEAKLKAEEERVSLEMRLVEREEDTLSEESKTTYAAINSQCGDAQLLKEQLDAQLAGVLTEIEELELRLTSKRAEERRLKLDVAEVDATISEVRRKYERQLARIANRMKAIEKNKAECASERRTFSRERESHDAKSRAVAEMVDKVENWSLYAEYELVNAEALRDSLQKAGLQGASAKDSEGATGRLRAALVAAEAALKKASSEQRDSLAKLHALTAEGADIDEKLPKLEAEKKAHAAAKRFKEAATAASGIKILSSRKDEISGEVSVLSGRIPGCTDAASSASLARDAAAAALRESVREEEIARFSVLLSQAREILSTKRAVVGSSVGFREIREAFVTILDTRLAGIVDEASGIKQEYCLEDSLDLEEGEREEEGERATAMPAVPMQETAVAPSAADEVEQEEGGAVAPAPAASAAEEEQGEQPDPLLEAARALRVDLRQLAAKMEQATEEENYDLCADLDEEMAGKQVALRALLRDLSLSEEQEEDF